MTEEIARVDDQHRANHQAAQRLPVREAERRGHRRGPAQFAEHPDRLSDPERGYDDGGGKQPPVMDEQFEARRRRDSEKVD